MSVIDQEQRTVGVELEKPVSSIATAKPHKASPAFFTQLHQAATERGVEAHLHHSDLQPEVVVGVKSADLGEQGLDNGFNLLETALDYRKSLAELNQSVQADLCSTQQALAKEGATTINMSIHPLGLRDLETYREMVAPKGVYPSIWYRGWDHTAGIDARAQNSPSTGVSAYEAAEAVSVIIGCGAAFVGLFANSPFAEGEFSGVREARLDIWERMMRNSKFEGDRRTARFPERPFRTMAQYFNWMFADDTAIHFVIDDQDHSSQDYKGIGNKILLPEGDPSVLDFLRQKECQAFSLSDLQQNFPPPRVVRVKPNISHLEAMQFAQFSGARIRFGFKDPANFPLSQFLTACDRPNSYAVEKIFADTTSFMYIEGRDPGANLPDQEMAAAGDDIARSVALAPAAIQLGLIRNLDRAHAFILKQNWSDLADLREVAIDDGLRGAYGADVYGFTKQVLEIAAAGLTSKEQKFLRYPEWVLQTRQNGADRALRFVQDSGKTMQKALVDLVKARQVVI